MEMCRGVMSCFFMFLALYISVMALRVWKMESTWKIEHLKKKKRTQIRQLWDFRSQWPSGSCDWPWKCQKWTRGKKFKKKKKKFSSLRSFWKSWVHGDLSTFCS